MKENKEIKSIDQVKELFDFLKGECPDGVSMSSHKQPKLTYKKAFSVIWLLQEHFRIIPDKFELCYSCGEIYDSEFGGEWNEKTERWLCESCFLNSKL